MILSSEITAHQVEIAERIIWTLTFAAQLVLLVVLIGRDRVRRYPWFTTGIVFSALTLMAEVLLSGRMAMLPLQEILISLGDLSAIVGLLIVVELAWQAFSGAPRAQWIANTAGLLVVSGGVLTVMGPWPVWKKLSLDLPMIKLYLMQFFGRKIELLAALLIIGVGVLVAIFGRSFKAGWRSHTQSIVTGLTAVGVSLLAREIVFNLTMHSARSDVKVMHQRLGFAFGHEIIYVAALVWWIVWLWRDEPGSAAAIEDATPQTSE